MKGTNKHCYMLNTQALSLVVLELEDFSHYKPTAHIGHPWGMVNLDPRYMVGRIDEGDYQTLLHTKY